MPGFLVLGAEAKTVQKLFRQPDVKLMNMAQSEALIQRYPYLSAVILRQGVVDFAKNIPACRYCARGNEGDASHPG